MRFASPSVSPSGRPAPGAADTSPNALLARVQAHVRELIGEDDAEFTRDLVASFCESVGALFE